MTDLQVFTAFGQFLVLGISLWLLHRKVDRLLKK